MLTDLLDSEELLTGMLIYRTSLQNEVLKSVGFLEIVFAYVYMMFFWFLLIEFSLKLFLVFPIDSCCTLIKKKRKMSREPEHCLRMTNWGAGEIA